MAYMIFTIVENFVKSQISEKLQIAFGMQN
jgi:hypothetical protein